MDTLTTYFLLVLNAMLVSNVVFAKFLGICPYLGVSKKIKTSIGMGAAVIFVMALATAVTWPLQTYVLNRSYHVGEQEINLFFFIWHIAERDFTLAYLQTIVFILIIASLVQLVEILMKKFSPPLYRALGIFLPLITTNCAILGVALICIQDELNFAKSMTFAIASGLGFLLAMVIFAAVRERLDLVPVPKCMRGAPIGLITAGILALAFMGFSGLGGGH